MKIAGTLALPLIVVVLACDRTSVPPEAATPHVAASPAAAAAPITTDRRHYVFTEGPRGKELRVIATLHAPEDQPLYVVNCNGASSVTLQREVEGNWDYAWVVGMNACLSPPIVIPPGGEHTATIHVQEGAGDVVQPKGAPMLEPGTYRVVWTGVLTAYDENVRGFGPELPLEQRISAPITINPAPNR